ncbi:MAG: tetratricopeptide repeat protein [Rhizobiaceae bacterium]
MKINNLAQSLNQEHLSAQAIRDGLARILASPAFAKSERLQNFLSYIIEESLAGRGDLIVGKTIAEDVYGRTPGDGSDNIVRVDARRLRRHLADYYASQGSVDPLRIHVDSGGYAPRFEFVNPAQHNDNSPMSVARQQSLTPPTWWRLWVALLAVVAIFMVLIYSVQDRSPVLPNLPMESLESKKASERSALADRSVATLQASNLTGIATDLLFPIADPSHQRLATTMYRKAIEIDPYYSDAYAGAAHSLATLSILSPSAEMRSNLITQANEMVDKAIELNPTNAWTQSAAAWLAYVSGEFDRAAELSQRSISLGATDIRTVEFFGLISLLNGDFEEAARVTNPQNLGNSEKRSLAYLNLFGVAKFHLGNYQAALDAFETAIRRGGPVSELTLLYKAASHRAAGNVSEANRLVAELKQTWPGFTPGPLLERFYRFPEHVDQVRLYLGELGSN